MVTLDEYLTMTPREFPDLDRRIFLKNTLTFIGTISLAGILTEIAYAASGTGTPAQVNTPNGTQKSVNITRPMGGNTGVTSKNENINYQEGSGIGYDAQKNQYATPEYKNPEQAAQERRNMQNKSQPQYETLKKEAEILVRNKSPSEILDIAKSDLEDGQLERVYKAKFLYEGLNDLNKQGKINLTSYEQKIVKIGISNIESYLK